MRSSAVIMSCFLVIMICGSFAQPAEGQIRRLGELSVTDIQAMDHSQAVVIIPAGLLEEHGPYLPAFSDGYQNERLSIEVAETLVARTTRPVVLFPTIPLGAGSPEDFAGRQPFSGSYTVRPKTLRAIFMDLGDALGKDGFRWIFILDSHGSPSHNRALIEAGNYFHDTYYGGRMVALTAYQSGNMSDLALRVLDGFDPSSLPNRADPSNEGFKTLDQNLLLRSETIESRQREWLSRNDLQ